METLSGLFNGIFLVFIAFNVFCEYIERIFEPQMIERDGFLLVSFLGLGVNMIGLFFFTIIMTMVGRSAQVGMTTGIWSSLGADLAESFGSKCSPLSFSSS